MKFCVPLVCPITFCKNQLRFLVVLLQFGKQIKKFEYFPVYLIFIVDIDRCASFLHISGPEQNHPTTHHQRAYSSRFSPWTTRLPSPGTVLLESAVMQIKSLGEIREAWKTESVFYHLPPLLYYRSHVVHAVLWCVFVCGMHVLSAQL